MACTYGQIESQVSNLLGLIVGADVSTTGTNYSATASTSNRQNPDFPLPAVQSAILDAVEELVLTICETPRHPERGLFATVSAALSNRDQIPTVTAGSAQIIGVLGRVTDASDSASLQPRPLDDVQNYNRFSSTLYSGLSPYWYAYNGQRIEHTRTTVTIEVCTFTRPTYGTATALPVYDVHEYPLVCGAVVKLAPREGAYQDLLNDCKGVWDAHLAQVRALGSQEIDTNFLAAPAKT